jgi:hypothetical protein
VHLPTDKLMHPRSAYSAHEHSHYLGARSSTSSTTVPLDIQIETLVSIALSCLGLVLGSEPLQPISWAQWAGEIEKEGGGRNPFGGLEDRVGFMDIRGKRKEFSQWARDGSVRDVKIAEGGEGSTGVET